MPTDPTRIADGGAPQLLGTLAARLEDTMRLILNIIDEPNSPAAAFYERTGWRYTHTTTAD